MPVVTTTGTKARRKRGEGQWAHDPESLLWARQSVDINREAGWDMLQRQAFREALYADCLDDDVALAYALLTPEPRGPLSPTESPIRLPPHATSE